MSTNNAVNTSLSGQTGTGAFVGSAAPTIVAPLIGAATATTITFNPTTGGIVGTGTNNNTTAGNVGEFISSVIAAASAVTMVHQTATDLTSIILGAGDWDAWGNISFLTFGTNPTGLFGWISSTSATAPDNSLVAGPSFTGAVAFASPVGIVVPQLRFSLAAPTTIYISGFLSNTSANGSACGGIYARRRR
jgi:hypothetical protein